MKLFLLIAPLALFVARAQTLPIENEFVRVLLATDQPAAKPGNMHEHKQNRVMIYLDAGQIEIRHSDGKTDRQNWKPGDIAWSPANGMHTSQNISEKTIRIVEIELKNAGTHGGTAALANNSKPVLDNEQVRVLRTNVAPKSGHYVAVDAKNATVLWDSMPQGVGPFIVVEIK